MVFAHHIPVPQSSFFYFFAKSGGIGVSFFFVLSGFLITYILICEKLSVQHISFKNFFARRTLKIWPLFYAMILFAFLTPYILNLLGLSSTNEGYEPCWWASLLFLENYKMMLTDSFPNVSPLRVMWSLCVEEHFYIIWCIVLSIIRVNQIPKLIAFCILLANLVRLAYWHYGINASDVFSNIDFFAYGAIPAYIYVKKKVILNKVAKVSMKHKYIVLALTLGATFSLAHLSYPASLFINPAILGILFSLIILFTICPSNCIKVNNKNVLNKLGVFTYGLYLYHTIVINLLLQLLKEYHFEGKLWVLFSISLLLTIIISILSYHLFEKKFLQLKKYFKRESISTAVGS